MATYEGDIIRIGQGFEVLPPEKIPSAVQCCILDLSKIEERVNRALNNSHQAGELAGRAAKVELAWYKVGDKAKAIEALQKAAEAMSGAQQDQADAIMAILDYQKKMSAAMKYICGLGMANIANNRAVVRAIRKTFEGASRVNLSEMARKELDTLITQLNAQEDVLVKQEQIAYVARTNKSAIDVNKEAIKAINALDEEQEKELARQRGKDDEHDRRLDELETNLELLTKVVAGVREGGCSPKSGAKSGMSPLIWIALILSVCSIIKAFFFL